MYTVETLQCIALMCEEKELFPQGLHCSSLLGVEAAAGAGCMRVESSGTALHCPLLVTGLHWTAFKMPAASLKPPLTIPPPGSGLAPIRATFSSSFGFSCGGTHSAFPQSLEKVRKKNRILSMVAVPSRVGLSPRNHEDAGGEASLSWGVEYVLLKKSHVGRQEGGLGALGCGSHAAANLAFSLALHGHGAADTSQKQLQGPRGEVVRRGAGVSGVMNLLFGARCL